MMQLTREKGGFLLCSSDQTSKRKGAASGPLFLLENINLDKDKFYLINQNDEDPMHVYESITKWAEQGIRSKLAFGGEHLMTLPLASKFKSLHPELKLVVLDAHHDAYEYHLLTHYSHFYYAFNNHNISILFVGVRYENEKSGIPLNNISVEEVKSNTIDDIMMKINNFIKGDPFYLSIDLDVIDPEEFKGISFPVPNGLSKDETFEIFKQLLNENPIFVDICEFNSVAASLEDKKYYLNFCEEAIKWAVK